MQPRRGDRVQPGVERKRNPWTASSHIQCSPGGATANGSPLRGYMAISLGPNSRGCARLRLAPPLATVGRPSGAAWHWGRLRPRGCARLRLAPPLATVGRPSGAAWQFHWARLPGVALAFGSLHPWLPSVAPPGLHGIGAVSGPGVALAFGSLHPWLPSVAPPGLH